MLHVTSSLNGSVYMSRLEDRAVCLDNPASRKKDNYAVNYDVSQIIFSNVLHAPVGYSTAILYSECLSFIFTQLSFILAILHKSDASGLFMHAKLPN